MKPFYRPGIHSSEMRMKPLNKPHTPKFFPPFLSVKISLAKQTLKERMDIQNISILWYLLKKERMDIQNISILWYLLTYGNEKYFN